MTKPEISLVVRELRSYVVNATRQALSTDVAIKAKHHLLDMLTRMFLGTLQMPSRKAVAYARLQSGAAEATEAGTDLITSTVNESLANGMDAHADKTDNTQFASRSHLECGVVPAALAMAENGAKSGKDCLEVVLLRYNISGRSTVALRVDDTCGVGHNTYSYVPLVREASAAGALVKFSDLISCNAQKMLVVNCWQIYQNRKI